MSGRVRGTARGSTFLNFLCLSTALSQSCILHPLNAWTLAFLWYICIASTHAHEYVRSFAHARTQDYTSWDVLRQARHTRRHILHTYAHAWMCLGMHTGRTCTHTAERFLCMDVPRACMPHGYTKV